MILPFPPRASRLFQSYRFAFDPEIQSDGSIDPLGIARFADGPAEWIFLGMTARMWCPRSCGMAARGINGAFSLLSRLRSPLASFARFA